ncbi:Microtubule binding protein [Mycena indigotica]|uniref:Microtubule binding protein n=1 Tax=Mycena indigotica TaxID=2126181 RepID=A0A8H6SAB8_9AGAR|nr:Microtubule binding protein [Mycena indigotica]KAF7295238.1 Microtubule binding protein [Mycena indigotica]
MTWPTRSAASLTRRISSSSDLTRPPTRSAVVAVAETVRDKRVASSVRVSREGIKDCRRAREATIGSLAESSSDRELESCASSDWYSDIEDRISCKLVVERGDRISVTRHDALFFCSAMASQPAVFTTQTPYPLPPQSFMIPTAWSRYQLSQLINKALSLPKPIPFDFLLRGDILKTSLADWCSQNAVGEEETLEIEYIESVLPPQKMADLPHDDWVSAVSCKLDRYFLTASYDGQLRAFDYSQKQKWSTSIHRAAITSFCIVPAPEMCLVATASHDLTAQLTRISVDDSSEASKPLASLHLHTEPVSAIASNASGSQLLTASWDGLVGLWTTEIPDQDEVSEPVLPERKKRRKVEENRPKKKAPLTVLKSHTGRVSDVAFGEELNAHSCGFDSSLRLWNLELGVCATTINCSERPFVALSASSATVVAASTDRTVSQYDFRESNPTPSAIMTHPATPSCLVRSPSSPHQVLSGAYDGVARIWDLRSVKTSTPVASFKVWEDSKKILSIDWRVGGTVAVGGERGLGVWKVVS